MPHPEFRRARCRQPHEADRAQHHRPAEGPPALPDNTAEKYALDQLVELRGGYARLANYYDINL